MKAVIVYPMNALANSQKEELSKFLDHGPWVERPVTFDAIPARRISKLER